MIDLASYGLTAQTFEFLCTLAPNATDIAPGLAESWTPNADNSVWTFKLRSGVKWQDGKDFTSADVVATMDRLVAAGNSGIKGVLDKGSAVATDPTDRDHEPGQRQRQLPVPRLGVQRPVADHPGGLRARARLADKTPNGTGAWKMVEGSYDIASGVKFVRNDTWWGGKTPLDGTEFTFFDDTASMVTAYQGGQIDALVQFDVLSGAPLFNDANFTVVDTPTTNHRQIWMHTDTGTFARPEGPAGVRPHARPAGAHPAAVQGQGRPGQRPRHLAVLPVLQRHGDAAGPGHREGQAAPVRCRHTGRHRDPPVRAA